MAVVMKYEGYKWKKAKNTFSYTAWGSTIYFGITKYD
jgi:hypothetical protein